MGQLAQRQDHPTLMACPLSAENVNHDVTARGMWFPLAAPQLTAGPHQGSTGRQALDAPGFPAGSSRLHNCRQVDTPPIATAAQDRLQLQTRGQGS